MMRALILAALLALTPTLATAHAQLHGADPPDGTVLNDWPASITLTFSEAVAPLVLRWIAPDGSVTDTTPVAGGTRVTVPPPPGAAPGSYLLSWRVISDDGHPVGGVVSLHLGHPTAQTLPEAGKTARAAALLRWWLTLAMVAAAGVAIHGALIARAAPRAGLRRFGLGAAAATILLASGFLGVSGLDLLGLPPAALLTPAPWVAALAAPVARSVALSGLSALAVALALWRGAARGPALIGWALAALSFAASGHAVTAPPRAVSTLAMLAHGGGLVFWMGALVPLLAGLRGPRAGLHLHRFSALAVPMVAVLGLSGGWLIWAQSGDLAALTGSAWGMILLAKLALVAGLIALAAINRLWLMPGRGATALAPTIRAELVLGLAVLALASAFRLTPPPRALVDPPTPLLTHLHTDRLMADLRLTPGRTGSVAVAMAFATADFQPLAPQGADIAFTHATAGIEPIRARATPGDDGLWRAGPVTLPLPGSWEVALRVLVSDFDSVTLRETVQIGD